jgi:hypothetical protein
VYLGVGECAWQASGWPCMTDFHWPDCGSCLLIGAVGLQTVAAVLVSDCGIRVAHVLTRDVKVLASMDLAM